MPMNSTYLRKTSDNKLAGVIRLFLAVMFLMTGAMKLLVPSLAEAWSGQLLAANIPLYTVSRWSVPFVEIALGVVLASGAFARPAAVVMMGIMVVATYVHLVVDDPSLFPLQPTEPIIYSDRDRDGRVHPVARSGSMEHGPESNSSGILTRSWIEVLLRCFLYSPLRPAYKCRS